MKATSHPLRFAAKAMLVLSITCFGFVVFTVDHLSAGNQLSNMHEVCLDISFITGAFSDVMSTSDHSNFITQ